MFSCQECSTWTLPVVPLLAKIKSIDKSVAMEIPGVLAGITGEDLKQYNLHWMPTLMSDTQMVLPTDTVMYQAQEVAAVITTDHYTAADAVQALENSIEYESMKPLIDPHKALDADAPLLRPDKEGKTDNHIWHWQTGDQEATEQAFNEADVVVKEQVYIHEFTWLPSKLVDGSQLRKS